jgi:transaldolase/glucose-6-phosphate isomerase
MSNQLQRLASFGQSIWLDNIRRSMFTSGELRNLIRTGLRGMTSNPTIFEKAIDSGNEYDDQLKSLIGKEEDPQRIFEALAIEDIRAACDEFRALYDETQGGDGFVSLEVSPLLADDTQGTIEAAKRLWKAVDRPNVMIKIPGTKAGGPAITEAIAAGVNVNVTLLFSLASYDMAANAYIAGLEKRAASGGRIDRIASVASFFLSRIDTKVDKELEAKIAAGAKNLEPLLGKAAIANAKLAYERFEQIFGTERFEKLAAKGAKVQRPLWASTSTKNPKYYDLMYVEALVGSDTVNTIPPTTLEALLDHGKIAADTVKADREAARKVFADLAAAGISLDRITAELTTEGVKLFAGSYNQLLEAIREKQKALAQNVVDDVALDLGPSQKACDEALQRLSEGDFLRRLWRKDPSPWSADPAHEQIITHALGWLSFPRQVRAGVGDLTAFAKDCAREFSHVVVMGMGGSSLAPDVLRATFGKRDGYPQLHVLDSSDPLQIRALQEQIDVSKSLFIVASKSGTTTEPDAFFRFFWEKAGGARAAQQFVAITDPATKLAREAESFHFRRVFLNDPDIGGRYSALSYFGMVPAALAGYDVATILDRGLAEAEANAPGSKDSRTPGVRFGAAIAALAKSGRDKLTIVCNPSLAAFGTWCEQLIAESTGKSGTGIVPIEGEPLGRVEDYGGDRAFVYVGEGLGRDAAIGEHLHELEAAGHPVIRLGMRDLYDIGEQFFLWEVATATAGSLLGIDAFDQPNVQESKDNTKRLLEEFAKTGKLSEPHETLTDGGIGLTALGGSKDVGLGSTLESAFGALFGQIHAGDYVAFTAYLPMNEQHIRLLNDLRVRIRNAFRVATTVGFGPRFLHSTGQLHKGGPPTGFFVQITYDAPSGLPIPGMVDFAVLERAQALGDFEALDKRGRRGVRVNVGSDPSAGLRRVAAAIDDAVAEKV